VVREGIATLVRLRSERGAKRIFELAATDRGTRRETVALGWETLISLPDDWIVEQAQSPMRGERLLAVTVIGEKKSSPG